MAYNTTTDYKALQNALKKQLEETTDAATKSSLMSQYNAAEQSRTEKLASNLSKYGQYASESELDSAAGIAAQNQIGTGYETQKANLNTSYDTAKQNANNDALSRGMARSSFVSDRQANLDSQRANALSGVDASQALALQNAKANILDTYNTNTANNLANQKSEFANTIGAYSNDYQAEVNRVQGNNDASDDWKIPYLQQARNEKIAAQEAAALKAKGSYSGSSGGNGGNTLTYSQLNTALKQMNESSTPEAMYDFIAAYGGQYADQFISMYGLSDYAPKTQIQRTSDYGSATTREVNDRINSGYTPQEVIVAAREKYGANSNEYQEIVSAALRKR